MLATSTIWNKATLQNEQQTESVFIHLGDLKLLFSIVKRLSPVNKQEHSDEKNRDNKKSSFQKTWLLCFALNTHICHLNPSNGNHRFDQMQV